MKNRPRDFPILLIVLASGMLALLAFAFGAPVFVAQLPNFDQHAYQVGRPNWASLPSHVLMVFNEAGQPIRIPEFVSLPRNSWVLTMLNEAGGQFEERRYVGYRSREECEKALEEIERKQTAKDAHCDP